MKPLKKASTVENDPVKNAPVEETRTESHDSKRGKAPLEQPLEGTGTCKVSEGQRTDMIREAAYFCAEQHGFQCDRSLDDWLNAEVDIDSQISAFSED
tara:strand:+ start:730 stop:1023 length:294 start_codon:yes stop_codon:yes gene_type:complete